jgi:hypothetical protein
LIILILRRKKDDPPTKKKHDPQTPHKGREVDNEEKDGFIMVSNKKAARRTHTYRQDQQHHQLE